MDVFAVGSILLLAFSIFTVVAFKVSPAKLIEIIKARTRPEVNIAAVAARASVWDFEAVVFALKREATVAAAASVAPHSHFVGKLLIVLHLILRLIVFFGHPIRKSTLIVVL